jgi:hypothetical protein
MVAIFEICHLKDRKADYQPRMMVILSKKPNPHALEQGQADRREATAPVRRKPRGTVELNQDGVLTFLGGGKGHARSAFSPASTTLISRHLMPALKRRPLFASLWSDASTLCSRLVWGAIQEKPWAKFVLLTGKSEITVHSFRMAKHWM